MNGGDGIELEKKVRLENFGKFWTNDREIRTCHLIQNIIKHYLQMNGLEKPDNEIGKYTK